MSRGEPRIYTSKLTKSQVSVILRALLIAHAHDPEEARRPDYHALIVELFLQTDQDPEPLP